MRRLIPIIIIIFCFITSCNSNTSEISDKSLLKDKKESESRIITGAERLSAYLDIMRGKRVGLVVNQTSMVGQSHLVDTLLSKEISIKNIFAPEHGFRGTADAGEKISDGKDPRTGIPVTSLYGKTKKPTSEMLDGLDLLVFDIQDVGTRFYTYISTMSYVMEACAENGIPILVLDRPNPNGNYVDGPVRKAGNESFVGLHPVPVVHGMTVGEYAQMVNGEGWLKDGIQCDLRIIKCLNYDHSAEYVLPVKPSPNLPNQRSIYLYPSLCFFEGTVFSVGRGTNKQFQVVGHPDNEIGDFKFTPVSMPGAKYPKHENEACKGLYINDRSDKELFNQQYLDLSYVVNMYQSFENKSSFFTKNNFFDLLTGDKNIRVMIQKGMNAEQIRTSWLPEVNEFKEIRKQYLLYEDFE